MDQQINKTIKRNILLNPGPATTSERVKKALIVSDICPREAEFGKLLADVRKKCALVVNGQDRYETVLLGGSGTGAIESVLSSCVDVSDRILIIENGAYGQRMAKICSALGIGHDVVQFDWGEEIDFSKVEKNIIDSDHSYRTLAAVHHETTTGILNPFSEIISLAKKYNLVSVVDTMSSYAGLPIDLSKSEADYIISSSNKCIHGMAGIGIVIAKREELDAINSFKKRSFYFDLYQNFYSQKEKGQFAFTPPVQTMYALNEALDEFFEQGGIEARSAQYSRLYEKMINGMEKLGFKPLLEKRLDSRILTTFFEPLDEKYSFEKMHDYLYERGVTIYPGKVDTKKTFRISNIGELGEEDMDFFLKNMANYLNEFNISLND